MSDGPYAAAARSYLDSGWHPLPLPWGKKVPPPKGMTGHDGHPPTIHTIRMWCTKPAFKDKAGGNVGLVMSDEVIGLDVDDYGSKHGWDQFQALVAQRGPLPATVVSTARDDKRSGIRFYRVPAGRKWKESAAKDIEVIQRTHRYAMVWPSIHDKLGTEYRWYRSDNWECIEEQIPRVEHLPRLPDAWIEELTEQAEYAKPSERVSFTEQDADGILTGGNPCQAVRTALDKYGARKTDDSARYIAMRNTQLEIVRLGEQGHEGVHTTIDALRELYLEDTKEEKRNTEGEFDRALVGAQGDAGAIRVALADPTPEQAKGCCSHADDFSGVWEPGVNTETGEVRESRWINLDDFLNGTYTPPNPNLGAEREDGIQLLYSGRWHTLIGLTTAGKTTWALWQVKAVLEAGGHVIYIHFEETSPSGIIHRLKGLGLDVEVMRKQLHWGHVDSPWKWGEMTKEIGQLEQSPQLAVLDGINAACGQHGWAVKEPESVGLYRAMFIHPLTKTGAAVLSLGHPPKAVNRQSESYSYGAAGWLNDVDGVGYRMTASKTPISKGARGSSALYVVKDRYGGVQQLGELQNDKEMAWWYMGQFVVDDSAGDDLIGSPQTVLQMTLPATNTEGQADALDTLGQHVIEYLKSTRGRFESVRKLGEKLRAKGGFKFSQNDLAPALERLTDRGLIEWPEVARGSRPGWLTDMPISFEEPDV